MYDSSDDSNNDSSDNDDNDNNSNIMTYHCCWHTKFHLFILKYQ